MLTCCLTVLMRSMKMFVCDQQEVLGDAGLNWEPVKGDGVGLMCCKALETSYRVLDILEPILRRLCRSSPDGG